MSRKKSQKKKNWIEKLSQWIDDDRRANLMANNFITSHRHCSPIPEKTYTLEMVLIKYFAAIFFMPFCQANLSAPFDWKTDMNDVDVLVIVYCFHG